MENSAFIPPHLSRHAKIADGCLVLLIPNGAEYDIDFDRLNTAAKALEWIRHLGEKQWITGDHLLAVALTAIQLGAEVHYGC